MKRADYSEEEMIWKTLLFREALQHANGESDLSSWKKVYGCPIEAQRSDLKD